MTLETKLKYPDCPECQLLDKIGLDRSIINAFHDDKIPLSRLPKRVRIVIRRYYKTKGWVKNGEN